MLLNWSVRIRYCNIMMGVRLNESLYDRIGQRNVDAGLVQNGVPHQNITYNRTSALSCFRPRAYRLESNAVASRSTTSPGSWSSSFGYWVSSY